MKQALLFSILFTLTFLSISSLVIDGHGYTEKDSCVVSLAMDLNQAEQQTNILLRDTQPHLF